MLLICHCVMDFDREVVILSVGMSCGEVVGICKYIATFRYYQNVLWGHCVPPPDLISIMSAVLSCLTVGLSVTKRLYKVFNVNY